MVSPDVDVEIDNETPSLYYVTHCLYGKKIVVSGKRRCVREDGGGGCGDGLCGNEVRSGCRYRI